MRCDARHYFTAVCTLTVALTGCAQHQVDSLVPAQVSPSAPVYQHYLPGVTWPDKQKQERLIYNFPSWPRGALPAAGLVAGERGEMYGATLFGGTGDCHDVYPGCGVVFKLTPEQSGFKESTVYNFPNRGDGTGPQGIVRDARGALYGLTSSGYKTSAYLFRLSPSGNGFVETKLYKFTGIQNPSGELTLTRNGALYGTNVSFSAPSQVTYGMIFRFTPFAGRFKERILYQFKNGMNGIDPTSPLLVDSSGVIYGTTSQGGTGTAPECLGGGCGTIFMLTPSATGYAETVLYNFKGTEDGAFPNALVSDGSGTLYASAGLSGGYACVDGGCGTLFSFNLKTRAFKVLHHFMRSGLWWPDAQLTFDRAGALYGTTAHNGLGNTGNGGVFKLARRGTSFVETTVHTFAGSPNDGQFPNGGLLLGPAGKALYGTTYWGGKAFGSVFEVTI